VPRTRALALNHSHGSCQVRAHTRHIGLRLFGIGAIVDHIVLPAEESIDILGLQVNLSTRDLLPKVSYVVIGS